jgi:glycerol dehydrogenase
MTGHVRVFAAPARYVQGPGALDLLADVVRPYAGAVFVVTDALVRGLHGDRIGRGIGERAVFAELDGEITYRAVDDLAALAPADTGVVVAIGGGKCLDAGKAVSARLGTPVVTVPSIASNDSPASAAIAMYDDNHVMVSVDRLARHPDVVLVDTELIAQAPVEFLRCGIGDAISKKFEADACRAGTGMTPVGGRPLLSAAAIADACYRTIRDHGVAALTACAAHEVTDDLEAVVEAVILMSGLGFENGGLSVAHALTRGLVSARGAAAGPHGRHVAWGLLVQLAAEGRLDREVAAMGEILRSLGLPVQLADLGMAAPRAEEIDAIAKLTMAAPHVLNMPAPVTAAAIAAAIRHVEALSLSADSPR